jgi:succinyl-CoA synthetase alpha subunit
MAKKLMLKKNEYHDSIQLMRVSEDLRKIEGVEQLMVLMATQSNKHVLRNMELTSDEIESAGKNDMIVAVKAVSEEVIENVLQTMDQLFKQGEAKKKGQRSHASIDAALQTMPDANLCLISLPGEFAIDQAKKALNSGLHVIIYSDNIPLEDDRAIKELAREKGLLCMGPDCGVTNINGVAFLTASIVQKGPIGIVGASGSGTQLITALTEREGLGISQAIGVGGKDLKDQVGGISMFMGIDVLEADPETKVIVLVSRTPGDETLPAILNKVQKAVKPVVVYFIGGDEEIIKKYGGIPASDLEDAALKAVNLVRNKPLIKSDFTMSDREIEQIIEKETFQMNAKQHYLRGLYCGGTFCDEAISQLRKSIGDVYSNAPVREELRLENPFISKENTVIDLGDEEFTLGRPHPVIDPEPVRMAILREGKNEDMAVMLIDFILGPAINPDPVGSVINHLKKIKEIRETEGGYLSIIASVCGTDGDPQNLTYQTKMLEEAGVIVMPSNAQAARLAGLIAKKASTKSNN